MNCRGRNRRNVKLNNAAMSKEIEIKSDNVCFTWSLACASRNGQFRSDFDSGLSYGRKNIVVSERFRVDSCGLEFHLEIEDRNPYQTYYDTPRNVWLKKVTAKPGTRGCFEVFINSLSCGVFPYEDKYIESLQVSNVSSEHLIISNVISVTWSPLKVPPLEGSLTNALVDNFASMLENTEFSDAIVETRDGMRFPVHRSVLAARSPVFFAMLKNGFLEAKERCIKIMDYPPETVKNMITYLYTSRPPKLTYGSAVELLKVSDKYNLKELKQFCVEYLLGVMKTPNAAELLLIADLYMENEMKEKVLRFISKHRKAFSTPEIFDCLSKHHTLLVEVINTLAKE